MFVQQALCPLNCLSRPKNQDLRRRRTSYFSKELKLLGLNWREREKGGKSNKEERK